MYISLVSVCDSVCMCDSACKRACISVCLCALVCACVCVRIYMCMCVRARLYMLLCANECVCVCAPECACLGCYVHARFLCSLARFVCALLWRAYCESFALAVEARARSQGAMCQGLALPSMHQREQRPLSAWRALALGPCRLSLCADTRDGAK